MKEIGETLKSAREEKGVTVEEAAEDLNLRVSQIENIEEGNTKAFKDVYYLKCFIRDYSKYLGLDEEKVMDDFNESMFEATSKIPIDEIEKASEEKQKEKEEQKEISSPYTKDETKKSKFVPIVVGIIIFLLIFLIGYVIFTEYVKPNEENDDSLTYLRG